MSNIAKAEFISRVNLKLIGCNPKVAAAEPEGSRREFFLMTVVGMVNGIEYGVINDTGEEYEALSGRFQAQCKQEFIGTDEHGKGVPNPSYDRWFESGTAFLPPGAQDAIAGKAKAMGMEELSKDKRYKTKQTVALKNGAMLNFVLDVFVKKASNASGITYVCKDVLPISPDDPMAQMRAAIAEIRAGIDPASIKYLQHRIEETKQLEAPVPPVVVEPVVEPVVTHKKK